MSKDKSKQQNENTPTSQQPEQPETLSPVEQMLKRVGSKRIPPSGNVRVVIRPNPREHKVGKE